MSKNRRPRKLGHKHPPLFAPKRAEAEATRVAIPNWEKVRATVREMGFGNLLVQDYRCDSNTHHSVRAKWNMGKNLEILWTELDGYIVSVGVYSHVPKGKTLDAPPVGTGEKVQEPSDVPEEIPNGSG